MSERSAQLPEEELAEVLLERLPLAVYESSQEHWDGLMRELALVAMDTDPKRHRTPRHLLELVDRLTRDYASFTTAPDADLSAALRRGDAAIDLTYRVPRSVGRSAGELRAILDEVDAYCRSGADLLSLERPAEVRRFHEWFLAQFVTQVAGEPGCPWPQWPAPVT